MRNVPSIGQKQLVLSRDFAGYALRGSREDLVCPPKSRTDLSFTVDFEKCRDGLSRQ